jgi:hypothetical protein
MDETLAADGERLRASVPEITATLRRMLERVAAGELATAPSGTGTTGTGAPYSARMSWL